MKKIFMKNKASAKMMLFSLNGGDAIGILEAIIRDLSVCNRNVQQ